MLILYQRLAKKYYEFFCKKLLTIFFKWVMLRGKSVVNIKTKKRVTGSYNFSHLLTNTKKGLKCTRSYKVLLNF